MKRDDGIVLGSSVGAAGAAVLALFTSACCVGPVVIATLGAGGALAAARLEPYRPWFLAGAGVLLALGFWRAYRPGCEGDACRARNRRAVRVVLWLSALVTLAAAVVPVVLS